MRRTSLIVSLFCFIALLLGAVGYLVSARLQPTKPTGVILLNQAIMPFVLQADDGTPFTNANLQHTWSIIFFGYTHCPDICPTTMYSMQNIMAQLAKEDKNLQENTQVVFISVDPKRDTPAQLQNYMAFFNPDFIGVTGTPDTLSDVAKSLFAIYETPDYSQPNYLVNHSGNLHIINPQGKMVAIFKEPIDNTIVNRYRFVTNLAPQ